MKQMLFPVLLLLTLSVSSTAFSQITGLKREQKVEIVSTLESYDAVLIETDIRNQLLSQCKEINKLLTVQLSTKDEIIENLKHQNQTYKKEVDIQDDEIRKQNNKAFLNNALIAGVVILALIIK